MSRGDKYPIKNVVFSSGAMGGFSFIGVVKALDEYGITSGVKGVSGCSAGSIIALLYSLGYSYDELLDIGMDFRYKNFHSIEILKFLDECGLETGKGIMSMIADLVELKIMVRDLTFKQHWNITGRDLWINASCVSTNDACYYSVRTSPNMSVLSAIRRSISVPFLFMAPRDSKGRQFTDGGYHDTIPSVMFSEEDTLCFVIKNDSDMGTIDNEFISFCVKLVMGMHVSLCQYQRSGSKYRIVEIPTGIPSLCFDLSRIEKTRVVQQGYLCAKRYFEG
jgi:predicted acylesterase/phospholipase RssA